jgi:hypothetical protein
MNIKKVFEYKFTYLVIGALITGIITYFFNVRLIEKEELLKKKFEKQNFVSELSEMLQKRIYNEEVSLRNVKNDARDSAILDSWARVKEITLNWNEQLPNFYFKLDIYFPPKRFMVKDYSNYLKNRISFREFLEKEIQLSFIPIHDKLVDINVFIIKGEEPDSRLIIDLEKNTEKLHAKIFNYCEALYRALND